MARNLVFGVYGPISRDDLPGLCDRVCALLDTSDPEVAVCEVDNVPADAVTVDALARLDLAARRQGCRVYLRDASPELLELVRFLGLDQVLVVEPGGEPEPREDGLGVEEEGQPCDPAAGELEHL